MRGGWKLALIVVITLVMFNILGMLVGQILTAVGDFEFEEFILSPAADTIYFYIFMSIQHISILLGILLVLKLIDKSSIAEIGLDSIRDNFRDLVSGLMLGALSIVLIFTFLFTLDQISIEKSLFQPEFTPHIFYGLYLFVLVGVIEEVFARGYCMKKVLNHDNVLVPVIGSSVIFMVMHLMNPDLSFLGLFNILLIGILFAYMFIKTGNLWMPIGYHITWNYFQGNIFGFSVSGMSMEGIYNVSSMEENIMTGGGFGLEGGLLATFVILLGFLAVKRY
ncbi:CPBP family intramembrane glutamic endopeptidase [Natranaerofaba carboxydovora]|uniref:CPBP family intramembrane glutamic endopeptidase n=1 Tax=Natranaerofaba carboxydovora TaxID=2742683 RepID=UPI001F135FA7|nr:CPBP family intramembrane glutamic endopeptidase [Natranaerofaba carboxydovora]UMZ72618.1 CAAX protease self-immunity [Natranaerofaba carboxydovora]